MKHVEYQIRIQLQRRWCAQYKYRLLNPSEEADDVWDHTGRQVRDRVKSQIANTIWDQLEFIGGSRR